MLFSSITFLYFFLPFTIFLYYFVPKKARNFVLLVMSVIFYAWGEPVYVFLMLAEILATYVFTLLMQYFGNGAAGRLFFILSVTFPFVLLFYFKLSPTLPIGISFYTFQMVSYCVDVRKGRVKLQKSLLKLAAYVTLFPQLVAGPIVRYEDVEAVLEGTVKDNNIKEYECDTCVIFGKSLVRFIIGLSKKVLIANVLGEFVTEVSALPYSQRGIILAWAYAAAVALQLYFDFSGYSDMAIGLGGMFGFSFPENFNYPFAARSVSEFWRRWHMTLGSWFRDYVYIPLGGNRKGTARWLMNIFIVWLFTGLWHGIEWNFVLWGLSFAILLVIEKPIKGHVKRQGSFINVIGHAYMVLVIMVTFLLFHNTEPGGAIGDITGLWGAPSGLQLISDLDGYLLRNRLGILLIGVIGATPFPKKIWRSLCSIITQKSQKGTAVSLLECAAALALLILCTAYLIDGSFNPFLYFRF